MKFKFILALGLFGLAAAGGLYAGGQVEEPPVVNVADPKVQADLSQAKITGISPLTVLPGTLVGLTGSGFGPVPGPVLVGGVAVKDILLWEDGVIFFRISKTGVDGNGEVTVGEAKAPSPLTAAPSGSITLKWTVDLTAFEKTLSKVSADFPGANLVFTPPLYIKGEWVKKTEGFGSAAKTTNWDNQSKALMLKGKGEKAWFYELVLTPENQASFGNKELRFGFSDGGPAGSLSKVDSDYTTALTKEWGANDGFKSINDPAVIPNPKEKLFDAKASQIPLTFIPRKENP